MLKFWINFIEIRKLIFRQLFGKVSEIFKSNYKNAKKFDDIWLNFWMLSGAKACKYCRSRQTFSHIYSFAFESSLIFPFFSKWSNFFQSCLKFTNFDANSPEFQHFLWKRQTMLDSQISWDFATEIVDFFRKRFSKSWKKLETI